MYLGLIQTQRPEHSRYTNITRVRHVPQILMFEISSGVIFVFATKIFPPHRLNKPTHEIKIKSAIHCTMTK